MYLQISKVELTHITARYLPVWLSQFTKKDQHRVKNPFYFDLKKVKLFKVSHLEQKISDMAKKTQNRRNHKRG